MANSAVQQTGANQAKKAAGLADSTVKTSEQGTLVAPTTTNSQLLG
jgi:hypothetical protein